MTIQEAMIRALIDPNGYSPESEGHNPMSNADYYRMISDPEYEENSRF